jgi:hypothetical protein
LLSSTKPWAERLPLLDHRGIDWQGVRRVRYFCYQRFLYAYPGPIHRLRQRLVVVPPDRYGDQAVLAKQLNVLPHEATARQQPDAFGNEIWQLEVERVEREIAFEVALTVERRAPLDAPLLRAADADRLSPRR